MRELFNLNSLSLSKNFISITLCISFAILWSIWDQPGTIAARNCIIIIGSIISIYLLWLARQLMSFRQSWAPISMVVLFFIWISARLFLSPGNFDLQWIEYTSVWKRSFLGVIFGVGLGVAVLTYPKKNLWPIFYFGLLAPTLIYFIRVLINFSPTNLGTFSIWALAQHGTSFYIPKTSYVFYCLPVLAVAFGQILQHSFYVQKRIHSEFYFLHLFTVIAVSMVFYLENIKNGVFYEAILGVLTCLIAFKGGRQRFTLWNSLLVMTLVTMISFFVVLNINKNESWRNFIADAKFASQVEKNSMWVDNSPLPLNELGRPISGTNYDRISWGIIGLRLIAQYPMGYGVLNGSFGHLARKNWPKATVTQSHSGWLDLAMGLGIPGVFFIAGGLISGLIAVCRNRAVFNPWKSTTCWIVLSICILFFTTEVSQNIYLESVFLIIGFTIGLGLYSPLGKGEYEFDDICDTKCKNLKKKSTIYD